MAYTDTFPELLGPFTVAAPNGRSVDEITVHFRREAGKDYTAATGELMGCAHYRNDGPDADPTFAFEFLLAMHRSTNPTIATETVEWVAGRIAQGMGQVYEDGGSSYPPAEGADYPAVPWPLRRDALAGEVVARLRGSAGLMAMAPVSQYALIEVGLPAFYKAAP